MSGNWRKSNKMGGFTLLEALIATALMGMILTTLVTITGQWLPNWNRGFARVQQTEQLALALDRVTGDLAAAEFVSPNRDIRQPVFYGANLSVTFVRMALNLAANSGLDMVRIAEVQTERGPTLVRTRARFLPLVSGRSDQDLPRFTDPVVLMRAPHTLSFSYAGYDRVWRDNWQDSMQLPRAIRLTLRDLATKRTFAVSTITPVHAELPAECTVAKSLAQCIESRVRKP
jgi:general secretion pathway protein J